MSQKVTIKDVAREAGVSVATVSYVVNNRTDMRISEETRKKVLQVINLLDYTPNQSAKALATNRNHMIALYLSPDVSILKNAEQLHFIHFLSKFLHERNYDLIYLSENYTEKFDHADAIVCYDISSDYFRKIGDCNFIPLIAVDCMIHDPLFFQINSDYEKIAKDAAEFFQGQSFKLAILETPNRERITYLSSIFSDICYLHDFTDVAALQGENLVVVDDTLKDLLEKENHLYYAPAISWKKAESLLQSIEYALQRIPIEQHDILV
ncbi:MAG: LacI family DNA-binding transcriptional regulator [Roseburia sp.]